MSTQCTPVSEEAGHMVVTHQTMLRVFIASMIRNPSLAEDTLSDVSLAIFQSWDRYDPSRPFPAWARGIARRVALTNLHKQSLQPCVLTDDLLEAAAEKAASMGDESELGRRKEALHECVQRLSASRRRLYHFRYSDDRTYHEISGLIGRSAACIHVVFHRLYKSLRDCVLRKPRLL